MLPMFYNDKSYSLSQFLNKNSNYLKQLNQHPTMQLINENEMPLILETEKESKNKK